MYLGSLKNRNSIPQINESQNVGRVYEIHGKFNLWPYAN
jgi:hypothetical protein